MNADRCLRCGTLWAHNAGRRETFSIVTRFCPTCVACLPKWGIGEMAA